MKNILIAAAVMCSPAAFAYDFNAAAQAVMNNPGVQQAVGQQIMQKGAANPGAVAGALGGCAVPGATSGAAAGALNMLGKLSPAQQKQLMATAQAMGGKVFTPNEQKALKRFQASPEGAGVMAKMPVLMEQLAPVVLKMYAMK